MQEEEGPRSTQGMGQGEVILGSQKTRGNGGLLEMGFGRWGRGGGEPSRRCEGLRL